MEFSTYSSRDKHLPLLIYSRALWSSSIFFSLFTVCRASINHIMFKHIHLQLCNLWEKRASLLFSHLCISIVFKCVVWSKKIIARYASSRFDDLIIEAQKKDNQTKEKVISVTLLSHLFIVIEINNKIWWLIVDTDDRSQMLKEQLNSWLLPFDYA